MKILITTQAFYPDNKGGVGKSAYHTAKGLAELEEVEKIVVLSSTEGQTRVEKDGVLEMKRFSGLKVEYRSVDESLGLGDIGRKFRNWKKRHKWTEKIEEEAEAIDADIIHAMNKYTYYSALKASRSLDIPVIVSIRNHWPVCFHGNMMDRDGNRVEDWNWRETLKYEGMKAPYALLGLYLRREKLMGADGVHFISHYIKDIVERHTKIPKKSEVIHDPVDFNGEWDDSNREEKTIAFAGRHTDAKGIPELLDAVEILEDRGKEYKFLIAGSGPKSENYKKMAVDKGLETVEFIGWVEDIREVYRRATVSVAPSVWREPFGRIGIEAMSQGSIPLVSKYGGFPETVPSKKLVIDPEDSEEFSDRIEEILESEELQEDIRSEFKNWLSLFSPEKVAKDLIKFFNKVSSA